MRPGNRRTPSLGLMLLLAELYQASTRHGLPPVTLAAIVGQIVVYLRLVPLPWFSSEACLSAYKILHYNDYWKLLIAQIEHGDDWHLYYNMVSFMWKGKSLETRMGPTKFALLLLLFTGATGVTYVGLNYALMEYFQDESYMYRCAVGFSGVIFALKVLTTQDSDGQTFSRMGIPIPISSKYAVWVELFLISLVTPNASFVGHLAGILVGLAYVYGPLKPILDFVHDLIFNGGRGTSAYFSSSERFTSTSQPSGYGPSSYTRPASPSSNYAPQGMTEEEQIRRATEESMRENYGWSRTFDPSFSTPTTNTGGPTYRSPPYSTQPTAEELRRIRLQRLIT